MFICFEEKKTDKALFFVQLLLFLGKFHIHKKKWTPNPVFFPTRTGTILQYYQWT